MITDVLTFGSRKVEPEAHSPDGSLPWSLHRGASSGVNRIGIMLVRVSAFLQKCFDDGGSNVVYFATCSVRWINSTA